MDVISLSRVSFWYPGARVPAVRDISLGVRASECVVLRGDVGSGKSSVLGLFNGTVPLSSGGRLKGDVRVAGVRPPDMGVQRMARWVSALPQLVDGFGVAPTVQLEVASGLEFSGERAESIGARVRAIAQDLQIGHLLSRKLSSLSGGERQLVALAATLVRRADVYVLDEPLAQLHPASRRSLMGVVKERLAQVGACVVMAEQEPVVAFGGSARVLALKSGRIDASEPFQSDAPGDDGRVLPGFGPVRIEATGLTCVRDRNVVLDRIDVRVRQGEIVAVVGPNGSGKTSLLRCIAGLLPATAGAVSIAGIDASRKGGRFADGLIGYLPQGVSSLFFRDSVAAELESAAGRTGGGDGSARLQRFGLSDMAERHPLDLSAGQRQWLALALIEAGRPGVLLLDEPTRGLHAAQRLALGAYLRERAAEGASIVLATHDWSFAARFADSVAVLDHGVLTTLGTPSELLSISRTAC